MGLGLGLEFGLVFGLAMDCHGLFPELQGLGLMQYYWRLAKQKQNASILVPMSQL